MNTRKATSRAAGVIRRHLAPGAISLLILLSMLPIAAQASGEALVFGPVTFSRIDGPPTDVTYTFRTPPSVVAPFRLIVTNGSDQKGSRVAIAEFFLNGELVLSVHQPDGTVSQEIGLLADNTLRARIAGRPGGFLALTILGHLPPDQVLAASSIAIGPAGGSGVLAGFATVSFPSVPQRPPLTLTLQRILSPAATALYQSETDGAGPSLPDVLRIRSSAEAGWSVGLSVAIPIAFAASLPSGYRIELFAEVTQQSEHDVIASFRRLHSVYDAAKGLAVAYVGPYAFTPSNSVVTNIVIGSYDDAPTTAITGDNVVPNQAVVAGVPEVVALAADLTFAIPRQAGNPLHRPFVVTSHFGPRPPLLFHEGVDIATNLEPVFPILGGTVPPGGAGPQNPCPTTDANGVCLTGFGHRVRLNHGNGVSSVYAHLLPGGLPAINSQPGVNMQIGTSDSTGHIIPPGPAGAHLHLEYLVDGGPVDPFLFIDQQDANAYLAALSVVALIDGQAVESTRRVVTGVQVVNDIATFHYDAPLDLALSPVPLPPGSSHQLSIVVQNANGAIGTNAVIGTIPLTIETDTFVGSVVATGLTFHSPCVWSETWDLEATVTLSGDTGTARFSGTLTTVPLVAGCLSRSVPTGFTIPLTVSGSTIQGSRLGLGYLTSIEGTRSGTTINALFKALVVNPGASGGQEGFFVLNAVP